MTDSGQRQGPKVRRVVTKEEADGTAAIWIDGDATNHKFPEKSITSTLLWSTVCTPTNIYGDEDEGARILGTAPPAGGSRFTMMEFQPGNEVHGLHRTDTIDYVVCVSGEIDMYVDLKAKKFVTLRPGDVVVQRGAGHAWVNRSDKPCRLAVVLIDAVPKREGSVSGMANAR